MKRIKLVCVGKASKPYFRDGCNEYLKRLNAFYDVTVAEIPENVTVKKECDEILKKLPPRYMLADIGGEQLSSEQIAELMRAEHDSFDEITFVIGGSDGVDERVRSGAYKRISFGRVTYPHQLARLILLEQLYRGGTILRGLPYHK